MLYVKRIIKNDQVRSSVLMDHKHDKLIGINNATRFHTPSNNILSGPNLYSI